MNIDTVFDAETLEKIAELDRLCFRDNNFERMRSRPDDFGDLHAYSDNGTLIGYAVYGQVWRPVSTHAYISTIAVFPHLRQLGWGLKILNSICMDLITRASDCCAVEADIRKSNLASQRLFKKVGFGVYCELDIVYYDETAIRVKKLLRKRT